MNKIKRLEVKSSNLVSVGYGEEQKTLVVEFKKSKKCETVLAPLYCFSEFPKELYAEFFKAESVGGFFHSKIKGKFNCVKVAQEVGSGSDSKVQ